MQAKGKTLINNIQNEQGHPYPMQQQIMLREIWENMDKILCLPENAQEPKKSES